MGTFRKREDPEMVREEGATTKGEERDKTSGKIGRGNTESRETELGTENKEQKEGYRQKERGAKGKKRGRKERIGHRQMERTQT